MARSGKIGGAALAGVLLLTACSSNSSGTTATSGNTDNPSAVAATRSCGNTLNIGVVTDFTGDLGSFGKDDLNGFKLAVAQINSSPGLPSGWQAKLTVADAQGKTTVGVQLASQMMESQNASFIVGPSSGEIVGMVNLAARDQVPVISQYAGTVSLDQTGGKWIYRTVASDGYDGKAAALWMVQQHAKNVVALIANDQSTVSVAHEASSSLQAAGGSFAKQIVFTPGQPSYGSTVSQALAANPEYVFLAGGQADGTTVLKELRDGGYSGPVLVSSDMAVPDVLAALGTSRSQQLWAEEPSSDTSSTAYQQFASAYKAKFGKTPGLFSANSYDAVMLGALAAIKAKSTCGAAINGALRSVADPPGQAVSGVADAVKLLNAGKDINYEGASGPVDLDSSGTSQGAYAIVQAKQGAWGQVKFYPPADFK